MERSERVKYRGFLKFFQCFVTFLPLIRYILYYKFLWRTVMSKIRLITLVSLAGLLVAGFAFAAPMHKVEARREISKTKLVIIRAHRAVSHGKNYTGDLALSIRHQKFAITLFNSGEFERSLYQTIRARRLAFAAIRANKGTITRRELADLGVYKSHTDEDLDGDFQKNGPQEDVKDEDVSSQDPVKVSADLDVKLK
jgi:hypothetical protein